MTEFIDQDQTCGIPGRKIIHSLSVLNDIWDIINDPKQARGKLIYLTIDQEKVFDKIEHQHISTCFENLNFGQNFRKWVKIEYTNIKSQLCIDGHVTETFPIL